MTSRTWSLVSLCLGLAAIGCADQVEPRANLAPERLNESYAQGFNHNFAAAAEHGIQAEQIREAAALKYMENRFRFSDLAEQARDGKIHVTEFAARFDQLMGEIQNDPTLSPEAKQYLVAKSREKRELAARRGGLFP